MKILLPQPPSPSFWPSLVPLVQISFSSQPSADVNVKRGSYIFHHFHQEDTEHSLAKLTHAQQATEAASYIFGNPQLRDGKPLKVTEKNTGK